MRLILMGTGPFAVPSFQAILEAHHEIAQVITRPSIVSPNKKEAINSPIRQWAIDSHLPLADPTSINDASTIEWLKSLQSDLFVVCDYGQILSRDALNASRLGGINLHGSLLPRHRGAAPVQWSVLSGDRITGVSVIHMTPTLDGGPILAKRETLIGENENAGQLEVRLSQIGIQATLDSIQLLASKTSLDECRGLGVIQDKLFTTKAPRLAKEDGELDCRYAARHLDRLVRGLQPWPGSFAHLQFPDGKSLRVLLREVFPIASPELARHGEAGELVYGSSLHHAKTIEPALFPFSLAVVVSDGMLGIPSLQPAGKRLMQADEFLRGTARYSQMRLVPSRGEHTLLKLISQVT